jgi:hypothetical protein
VTTPQAFYIKNHTSSELHAADVASLPTLSERPKFASKDLYAKWCHDAGTEHVFYTLAEPAIPSMRSSGSNPIKFLHGIVADYDGAADAIQAGLPKLKFAAGMAPSYFTTTFSGKARLVWLFERPVPTFSPDVFSRFIKILSKELKLKHHLAGLDEGALENPYTPYELGTEWRQPFGDTRLPLSFVMTALHDASAKAKFKSDGPDIPLEAVAAEVEKKFPGRWQGPFVEGAKGVRFWDKAADNPTGATIRANGVQAWTGEAAFLGWGEVLGTEFVKQYRQNRIGGAIGGIFFDGKSYWKRDGNGVWRPHTVDSIKRHLKTEFSLSAESKKGGASEAEIALSTIDNINHVDGAFPCLFMKDEIVADGPMKFVNVARVGVVPASGKSREWGDGFPWIASYVRGLFPDDQQFNVFMSWLAWFYNNARVGRPRKGHALFVAGGVGIGKTVLSQLLVGGLMGGSEEATRFMLGETQFNESLFHRPVWAIDDAEAGTEAKRHGLYSQLVKKFVANPKQQYRPMFQKAVSHKFDGRLVVTLNDDPTSMLMLPQVELSILDKIIALIASNPGISFAGVEQTIPTELPAFADFLSGWSIPQELCSDPGQTVRFGFTAWQNPTLMGHAKDASPVAALIEFVDHWRVLYFRQAKDDGKPWTGSATALYSEFSETESLKSLTPKVVHNMGALGRGLQTAVRQGCEWITSGRDRGGRFYEISRPTKNEK